MPENNQLLSVESQLVGLPLAGPESFSQAQLDYLKRALGVDETVLWTGSVVDGTITLSEAMSNFNEVEVWMECTQTNPKPIFKFNGSVGEITAAIPKGGNGDKYLYVTAWTVSGTTISFRYTIIKGVNEGTIYKEVKIVKVVGIGRKESA
jgi:hypothetical protein